ncbi:MAG: hypothetical protein HUK19_01195 [Fibrobacter sp.]|nr:hypothetical protein [Fibrobacter sp.]
MQFYKFLAPVMLGAVIGLTACDNGTSSDPVNPPSDPNQGINPDPVNSNPVVPDPVYTPTVTPALGTGANILYPANMYVSWKAGHFVTIEDESVYYAAIVPEFYEGVFLNSSFLPTGRVKWSVQASNSFYGPKCSVSETTVTTMKFRGCSVSEGTGYGMLISYFAGDFDTFNRLWNYSRAFRAYHNLKLTPWITKSFHYEEVDNSSATDADLDIATALILASYKMSSEGNAALSQAYLADALTIVGAIWDKEVNKSNFLLYSGDTEMWTMGDPAYNLSYFSPVALRLFALVDKSHDWTTVLNNMYAYMINVQAAGTGVFPDWSNGLGLPVNPDNGSADRTYWTFNKESVRIPWRIAWDYYWYGSVDANPALVLNTLNNFIVARSAGDPNSTALNTNYSANLAVGQDIVGSTVQNHWYGAWCLTGIAANPTWLNACTDGFNAKVLQNSPSSYFLDILQMMMSQLLNGAYVKPIGIP